MREKDGTMMQTLELGILSLQDNIVNLETKYTDLVNFYKKDQKVGSKENSPLMVNMDVN